MALAIRIDRAACHGSRECVRRAPRTFSLDGDGKSRASATPGDDDATIRAAASACPFFAIEVRDPGSSEAQ